MIRMLNRFQVKMAVMKTETVLVDNVKGRGRPVTPLRERLASVISHDLDFTSWPNLETSCWFGPKRFHLNGRTTTTLRAMFAALCGLDDFHETWRVVRWKFVDQKRTLAECREMTKLKLDCHPDCVNPHHHEMILMLGSRKGTRPEPLPPIWVDQIKNVVEDDVQSAIEWIESDPVDRKPRTAEQLHAMAPVWTVQDFEQALTRLKS